MPRGRRKNTPPTTDLTAGARAYNRLDLQISQAVLFTIELYSQANYLILMDYYDDIVVFDDATETADVSFYQVKTKGVECMEMSTILSQGWLEKLYSHIRNPKFVVKELAFVTNTPITYTLSDDRNKKLENPRTAFSAIDNEVQNSIKNKISETHNIPIDKVDLSKFCHLRTTLSIDEHRCIAESKFSDFLYSNVSGQIDIKTVKTIFAAIIEILTRKQAKELAEESDFNEVQKHKGFTKNQFSRIIDETMTISLPPIQDILGVIGCTDEERSQYNLGYSRLLGLQRQSATVYREIIQEIQEIDTMLTSSDFKVRIAECLQRLSVTPGVTYAYISDKYPDIILAAIELKRRTAE